jgi:N-acetylglutamate synthase-like GNAT family acetyltransferase
LHRSFIACCIDSISNTALAKIDELKLETPIKVREAVASDRQEAEEVTKVAFSENRAIYEPTLLARERARSDPENFVRLIAAGADDAVIGTLLYRVEGDCLHVRALAVHPGWRGQGIARRLLDAVAEKAATLNMRAVSLVTILEAGKVGLFEHLGFRKIRQFTDESTILIGGRHSTAVEMERRCQAILG